MTILSHGSESKRNVFWTIFIDLISFFFQLFLSPLIYIARAIFEHYPEIEKKCNFLKIDKVKNFSNTMLFLAEKVNLICIFHFFKFWRLLITGSWSNLPPKSEIYWPFLDKVSLLKDLNRQKVRNYSGRCKIV